MNYFPDAWLRREVSGEPGGQLGCCRLSGGEHGARRLNRRWTEKERVQCETLVGQGLWWWRPRREAFAAEQAQSTVQYQLCFFAGAEESSGRGRILHRAQLVLLLAFPPSTRFLKPQRFPRHSLYDALRRSWLFGAASQEEAADVSLQVRQICRSMPPCSSIAYCGTIGAFIPRVARRLKLSLKRREGNGGKQVWKLAMSTWKLFFCLFHSVTQQTGSLARISKLLGLGVERMTTDGRHRFWLRAPFNKSLLSGIAVLLVLQCCCGSGPPLLNA